MLDSAARWSRTMMACGSRLSNPAVQGAGGLALLALWPLRATVRPIGVNSPRG